MSRINFLGGRAFPRRVILPALVLPFLLTGGVLPLSPTPHERVGCWADVSHPLDLRVFLDDEARAGAVLRAHVEVRSTIDLDDLTIRVITPDDIDLLTSPRTTRGRLRSAEVTSHAFTLRPLPGNARGTVEVLVEATVDGVQITRGATLNLAFERESFRIVTTPDGRRVREVPARRIG